MDKNVKSVSINIFNRNRFENFKNDDGLGIARPHKSRIENIHKIFNSEFKKNNSPFSILDVGCADGSISAHFLLPNVSVFGLDSSEHNVFLAQKKGINAVVGDISNCVPFSSNTFNMVLMGELIEHLFDPDFAIKEAYRVLKNDGSLVLTFPNISSLPNRVRLCLGYDLMHFDVSVDDRHGGHIRGFNSFNVKKILLKHNFKIVKIFGSSVSFNPFKRTNSNFGVFMGRLFPSVGDLLIVHAKKLTK